MADEQLEGLELKENEHQTDNEKSKKLTSELSSVNDIVSYKGVVRKQQDIVGKESKALEEALDKVRKVQHRLDIKRENLEEEQQALELLLQEQENQRKNVSKTQRKERSFLAASDAPV